MTTPVHRQPPRPRATRKKREAVDRVQALFDAVKDAERGLTGYNHLSDVLASLTGQPEAGTRLKGPPIFTYKASLDGVNVLEIAADLKLIPADQVAYVLAPLIYAHARQLKAALANIMKEAEELDSLVDAALTPQPAPPPDDAPVADDDDVLDEEQQTTEQ